jgi:ribosomal protein L30
MVLKRHRRPRSNRRYEMTSNVDSKETVRIRQVGSQIRRDRKQALYLKSLGLRGIGSEKVLKRSSSVDELIKKVGHMVEVIS